jgi:hypothetical protein
MMNRFKMLLSASNCGATPWFRLDELDEENPLGLMQVLAQIAEKETEVGRCRLTPS